MEVCNAFHASRQAVGQHVVARVKPWQLSKLCILLVCTLSITKASALPLILCFWLLPLQGYAVVDGVFGAIASRQLELELMHVWSAGLMHLNHTHLVNRGETTLLAKSQVRQLHRLCRA